MFAASGTDAAHFKTVCSSVDKLDKQPWEEVGYGTDDAILPPLGFLGRECT